MQAFFGVRAGIYNHEPAAHQSVIVHICYRGKSQSESVDHEDISVDQREQECFDKSKYTMNAREL